MGTYYVPPVFQVMNALSSFHSKFKDICKGLEEVAQIPSTNLVVSTQSALNLSDIRSSTIDYVFTDPPYSWKVQYGESNFIWEGWMKFDTAWLSDEVIVNPVRNLDEQEWKDRMLASLRECYRVLKPGRWLSLCYHDTSEGTWEFIQDIASEAGFISEKQENTIYIDASQKSWKQIVADKVTRRDLVINFRKPGPGEVNPEIFLLGDEDQATFAQKAYVVLYDALQAHPGSTIDRLYDELVSRMVRKGDFERHDFDALLRGVAEEVDGRWYLRETADQIDEAESAKESAAAGRLEAFMIRALEEQVGESGVHYSDLFEQYLPVQDKPRRRLADWLPEFFFKTPEGTWRPPATDEERAQKEALRSSGALRRIKRFANALLEGVPPGEHDRPATAATAADWIRQCRRAGLYELGRVMYEKGALSFDELSEEGQLEVQEDYQLCVRRSHP